MLFDLTSLQREANGRFGYSAKTTLSIAQSLYELADARIPVVATIIGEGGSGGALALALADRVMMLEHSVYSVASPEGAAAILWGDSARAEEAASRLRLTADDLMRFGIVDEIVPEPLGGAHRDPVHPGRVERRRRPPGPHRFGCHPANRLGQAEPLDADPIRTARDRTWIGCWPLWTI